MTQRILACLLASIALAPMTLPAFAQDGSGQIEHYERKYISFFYAQDLPLNDALANAFQNGFPRFDYHLSSTALDMDFGSFLNEIKAYQERVAGDIAAGRTPQDARFGDKVVSWSETQKIANAAHVFAPVWTLGEVTLDGPYPENSSEPTESDWTVKAESDVEVEMGIWSLAGEPRQLNNIDSSWTASLDDAYTIPVAEVLAAVARYNIGKAEDDKIDIEESLDADEREALLKELREVPAINSALRRIENQDPYQYMMDEAVKDVGYGAVISSVQHMPEFLIRAEITEPDMAHDKVTIGLEGETPESLGIGRDSGYKIVEYVQGNDKPREVGYVKVRDLGENSLVSQPIIVARDFELGDQVVEYPKAGVGINLRGGAMFTDQTSPGVSNGQAFSQVGGGGMLDIDFNIGPALGTNELYFLLSGGYYSGHFLGEIGLTKKWYMRQLIFALTGRAGGSYASGPSNSDIYGGGVAGLAGLHWQASPDFAFGLEGGWRQYSSFGGPVVDAFIRFDL